MKLRADDQAAQPQKREIYSLCFPAESHQTAIVPFFPQSASCVMYLSWSGEPGMLSHLKQTAVKLSNTSKGALSRLLIKKIWYEYDIVFYIGNNQRES